MSSMVAVLRSARHALRRAPFPRVLIERQPLPRAQNSSTRRFYSADCTAAVGKKKPAPEMNKATAVQVEDSVSSRKLDEIILGYQETHVLLRRYGELMLEKAELERRRKVIMRGAVLAGVLATIYVKYPFFGGAKEDKKIMSTENN